MCSTTFTASTNIHTALQRTEEACAHESSHLGRGSAQHSSGPDLGAFFLGLALGKYCREDCVHGVLAPSGACKLHCPHG